MKQFAALIAIALSLSSLACGSKEKSKTQVTPEDVKRDAQKAVETTETYTQQQKEKYQKKVEAELNELDHRIAELKTKTEKAGPKARAEMDKETVELRKKQAAARQQLEELKAASTSTWEEVKKRLDTALNELKQAYDRAVSRLKSYWRERVPVSAQ